MAHAQYIFIDDSGDPSFGMGASKYFVMSAAVFDDGNEATKAKNIIVDYRKKIGWQDNHEFKFSKSPKRYILELLSHIHCISFNIYTVFIDKKVYRQIFPIIDDEKLYNWAIKELLQDISPNSAKIVIDGRASKQYMHNTATYLRKSIKKDGWHKLDIRFGHSDKIDLLQLADIISGSINRSLQPDKTDSQKYISIFKDKIKGLHQINLR